MQQRAERTRGQSEVSGQSIAAGRGHGVEPAVRAWRSPKSWIILLSVLLLGLALDIGTKYWSFEVVAGQPVELDREELLRGVDPTRGLPGREVLPWGLLDFRLVINHGAVFGIGQDRRVFFIGFTLIALAAGLIVFARFTNSRGTLAHVGLGLILAGGIGNLYDRIVYGVVRDFLHMLPGWNLPFGLHWPNGSTEVFPWVFNVADMMLLCGMALLMIHIHRVESARHKHEQSTASSKSG